MGSRILPTERIDQMADVKGWKGGPIIANRRTADLFGLIRSPDRAVVIAKDEPGSRCGYLYGISLDSQRLGPRIGPHWAINLEKEAIPVAQSARPPYINFVFIDWPVTRDGRFRACAWADSSTSELAKFKGKQIIVYYDVG